MGSPFPFPDLILLDVDMPQINGWEFMRYLEKLQGDLPTKPIIYMLTSFLPGSDIMQEVDLKNVEGIYQKPLTHEILKSIFEKHFICA